MKSYTYKTMGDHGTNLCPPSVTLPMHVS